MSEAAHTDAPFADAPMPVAHLRAVVVVPARDEAARVLDTLNALRAQVHAPPFEVLLLCNNCRDNTADVARNWASHHNNFALHIAEVELTPQNANIGTARRLLMNAAYSRLNRVRPNGRGLIASTDADSVPEPTWLRALCDEISRGVEAVGARVLTRPDDDLATRRVYLLDTAYRFAMAQMESRFAPNGCDPWPRGFQFFGAGLALTCRTFERIGGVPRVACLEDVALKRALTARDISVRHSVQARVWTAARRDGRVQTGLSSQLREWQTLAQNGSSWLVPPASEVEAYHRVRVALHRAWQERAEANFAPHAWSRRHNLACWAQEQGVDEASLRETLRDAAYFGEAWQTLMQARDKGGDWLRRFAPVPVEEALRALRARLRELQ